MNAAMEAPCQRAPDAGTAAARTGWRDVPFGPRSIITALLGKDRAVRSLAEATALREVLPEMPAVLHVELGDAAAGLDRLLGALSLEHGADDAGELDAEQRIVDALVTQDVCSKLVLHRPSACHARVVGAALRHKDASWRGLSVHEAENESGGLAALEGLAGNRTLVTLAVQSDTSSCMAKLDVEHAALLGDALGGTECALQEFTVKRSSEVAAVEHIAQGVARNQTLRTLHLHVRLEGDATQVAQALGNALKPGNTPLEVLRLSDNSWLDDASNATVVRSMAGNTTLQELDLTWCGVGPSTAMALGAALDNKSALRVLRLGWNKGLGDEAGALLAAGMTSNETLEELNLQRCAVGPATASGLASALGSDRSSLRVLAIGCNRGVDDAAGALLAAGLASNRVLRKLDLRRCDVGVETAQTLARALRFEHSALEVLDVSFNEAFDDAAGAALAQGLANNRSLRELFLCHCGVGSETVAALAEALRCERSGLQVLDLQTNVGLGDAAGACLARALQQNQVLRELDMTACSVGAETARALGATLAFGLSALEVLMLGLNSDVGDLEGAAIAHGLARNCVLRQLGLYNCGVGRATASALSTALRGENSALRVLKLDYNPGIDDEAGAVLARGLERNCVLHELLLHKCAVGVETATALADALRSERSALRVLNLGYNAGFGNIACTILAEGLAGNSVLSQLYLCHCGAGPATAAALGAALGCRDSALQVLDMRFNEGFGNAGGAALAVALERNAMLARLNLHGCNVGAEVEARIRDAARRFDFQLSHS